MKCRFAPSPTGYLHIGGLRTALYNFLYAKKINGEIILRIEDTDQSRKVENAVENLIFTFKQMKITFDEGPNGKKGTNDLYFQSQRLNIYNKYVDILLKNGNAYPCFCSTEILTKKREEQANNKQTIKYDRHCLKLDSKIVEEKKLNEKFVIRMRIPTKQQIVFYDMVRDKISINSPALANPDLINDLAHRFGSQCVGLSVDSHLEYGAYVVYQNTGNPEKMTSSQRQTKPWVSEAQERGAGEVVLNCMNQDGVRQGYDITQLAEIRANCSVPLIASGGAGNQTHFLEVFQRASVDGALAASVFHSGELPISKLKSFLNDNKVDVRLC